MPRHLTRLRDIATGLHGEVSLYTDDLSNMIAVKALTDGSIARHERSILEQLSGLPSVIEMVNIDGDHSFKGKHVIATKFYKHGELYSFMAVDGMFNEKLCRSVFMQLVLAVKRLHQRGIAHRDLKPENILVDDKFNLRIADFGLAFQSPVDEFGKFTRVVNDVCGTPPFLAPEVLACSASTSSSVYAPMVADMWSLGCMLFLMLTGNNPFAENHATNKDWYFVQLRKGRQEAFWAQHCQYVAAPISAGARALIERMLTVDAMSRATVDDVLQDPWLLGESEGGAREVMTEVDYVAAMESISERKGQATSPVV